MPEILIFVDPVGVRKTQVITPRNGHRAGIVLYERILPKIREIHDLLRDTPEEGSEEATDAQYAKA